MNNAAADWASEQEDRAVDLYGPRPEDVEMCDVHDEYRRFCDCEGEAS